MSRARAGLPLAVLLALAGPARPVAAYAVLEVRSADAAGEGFEDPTPAAPVGGNAGRTLGEQRLNAVQHAADLWGEALDSEVTIVIEATFDPLGCTTSGSTTLAYASTLGLETGIEGDGGNPDWLYPAALADRLMGEDLRPGEPDIVATFNSSVDENCVPGLRFYYGLDAEHGAHADLVNVALHELGHGLGVANLVDPSSGALVGGMPNPYAARVLDIELDRHWDELSDAERFASQSNVRNVVWDGPQVIADAPRVLAAGTPSLSTTPAVAELSGLAGDASFGAPTLAMSISAELAVAADGCPQTGVAGRIALLRGGCAFSQWVDLLEHAGAVGVLLSAPAEWRTPPPSFEEGAPEQVQIPVLSVSEADAALLQAAAGQGAVDVHLSYDDSRLRGADAEGRVLLHASNPATSSSVSHWETLARPNLLMEPIETPHADHDVDLTRALLIDIGWTPFCGNGRIDQEEPCDDGADNDDEAPNACRTSCVLAGCGDGVLDRGEACDDGEQNSDSRADACRTTCERAGCGDGVVDDGEPCDQGERNSDSTPDACRTTCVAPSCGDGVEDRGEECDTAAARSDRSRDACRSDCVAASCGDGVLDSGEACDDGANNDDARPGACRRDCSPARCGDGVIDVGEECDEGEANDDERSGACRSDCTDPHCGDGVVDVGETCEPGVDDECTSDCATRREQSGRAGSADAGDDAGGKTDDGGCGCRVAGTSSRGAGLPALPWVGVLALGLRLGARIRGRRRLSSASSARRP